MERTALPRFTARRRRRLGRRGPPRRRRRGGPVLPGLDRRRPGVARRRGARLLGPRGPYASAVARRLPGPGPPRRLRGHRRVRRRRARASCTGCCRTPIPPRRCGTGPGRTRPRPGCCGGWRTRRRCTVSTPSAPPVTTIASTPSWRPTGSTSSSPTSSPPVAVSRGAPLVGGSVHLHSTDGDGEWTLRAGDDGAIVVTRDHAKADAALRGEANDLLLVLWRRLPIDAVDVFGDEQLAAAFVNDTRHRVRRER